VKGGRTFGAWLTIASVVIAAGCAPKRISGPISGPMRPGQSLTVLLQDSDTLSTGAARVSNPFGSVDLEAERDVALATADRKPVLGKLSEEDVEKIFGDALSALPPPPGRFTLFFRFESDALTDQSQALIPEILAAVKKHAVQDVVVVGHTDTMGTQQANYGLGLKRAMMVRNLLVQAGLDGSTIEVTSVGELDLLVTTPDETPEPRNRRVDIAVR
jgi:outer membrane protein OmpA-like peptidoglycan-associated protein